ncbi:MAG: hypothetical protein ACI87N_003722, partial [Flavobacteriales bacterium]
KNLDLKKKIYLLGFDLGIRIWFVACLLTKNLQRKFRSLQRSNKF